MTDEILRRIDVFAAKLGVAAEHLWGVLVKQAYVEGCYPLIMIPCFILSIKWFLRSLKAMEKAKYKETSYYVGAIIVSVFLSLVTLIILGTTFSNIGFLYNPEYFAIEKITRTFK